jgi:hypothetical protein
MNEAAKVQAEAIFKRREAERAEFEPNSRRSVLKPNVFGRYGWPEKKRDG